MSYTIHLIWEGCNVADTRSRVTCASMDDVKGMVEIMRLADAAPADRNGFHPKLAVRVFDAAEKELFTAEPRNDWSMKAD